MSVLEIQTAAVFEPLLHPARYKAAFGGRGSGKSHFLAEMLVEDHARISGLRSVCIREVQKSLKESAKRLIEDKIRLHGLEQHGFEVLNDEIRTPGGGLITFSGMQDHTAESIKSLEGVHRAWVEEAQSLSARSLQLLRPTIRAHGSEIWFSWNPRRKTDPVDALFRDGAPPTNAVVARANWDSNPWFPPELGQERLDCLRNDPDQYAHIWEGDYVTIQAGAYYARCLAEARGERRIGHVARDPLLSIRAFWDIGGTGARADACSIWIAQFVGREIRVLDYYEAQGQPFSEHVAWLRGHGYGNAECILPHDGINGDKVFAISPESFLRQAGFGARTVKNQGTGAASARVETARRLFPQIWFDGEKCAGGLDALGWYHEKRDEDRGIGLGPDHDWSSHAADAFGLMCIDYNAPVVQEQRERYQRRKSTRSSAWAA